MEPLASRIATALKILNPKGVALGQATMTPTDRVATSDFADKAAAHPASGTEPTEEVIPSVK